MKTSLRFNLRSFVHFFFGVIFSSMVTHTISAQTCTMPNNTGQCSGGQGQVAVAGHNIGNGENFWSTINRTVTGSLKINNGGRLTVCSGVLTLNNLDMAGGRLVILQGATVNVQNAVTLTGASEIFNYGTINFNNNITLQGADSRIYNQSTGIINVSSPYQLLINNNAQLINANVVVVHTINLNVNNPNPNAVCMGTNSVMIATNVIDQTSNNNGIVGLTNSCVSIGNSYTLSNTSPTPALMVCYNQNATGSGSFGQATPTQQCTSCGVLQAANVSLSLTGDANNICSGQTITLTQTNGFLPYGMTYQWGTGTVGTNIINGANTASISVSPNSNTTYWVRMVEIANPNNAGSSSATYSVTVNAPSVSQSLVNTDMVWTGRVSNNWNNTSNWLIFNNGVMTQAAAIPELTQNVIIPAFPQTCVARMPTIQAGTRNAKRLIIENNASLTMTGGTLRVDGDFINNGTFTPGTNLVTFNGATNQSIQMVGTSNTFYNMTVNKTGGEVILNSPIKVSNDLTMTARNIKLNGNYIDLMTTGNIVNENESSNVYCFCPSAYVQRTATIGSNVTTQPGNLGITFTTNGNAMGNTVIRRKHYEAGTNGVTGVGVLEETSIARIYEVIPQYNGIDYNGNLNVDVNVQFFNFDAQNVSQTNNLSLYRSQNTGMSWENLGYTTTASNNVLLQGVTGFSWITVGPNDGNVLPIELIAFNASAAGSEVHLNWSTASELNNDYFTVERSKDGLSWEEVVRVDGAGNSIHRLDYSSVDKRPYAGLSYYRLKQTDFDGQYSISKVVSVVVDAVDKHLLYVVNTIGQKVDIHTKGMVILVFSNGETTKMINE